MNQTNPTRTLTRSSDDRFVGGVAAGIAQYFNIDPVFVRAAFVISVAFGGIGVLAYLILLVMVPIDGDPGEPAAFPTGRKRFWVISGTVVLGILALASIDEGGLGGWFFGIGPGPLFGVLIWILALAGVFWLVREATRGDNAESGAFGRKPGPPSVPPTSPAAPPSPPVTTDPTGPAPEGDEETAVLDQGRDDRGESPTAVTATMAGAPTQNAPAVPHVPPPGAPAQRNLNDDGPSTIGRIMTWFAIGITALILFSVLAVFSAGVTAIFGAIPMAALVILLGVGLVTAAVKNRRQLAIWMLAAALVIALPMATIAIADLRVEGSYGDISEEPMVATDIPGDGYEMAAGATTIDLRSYPFRKGETVDLPVRSGIGATSVIVPDDVCVTGYVEGKVGFATVRGVDASGAGIDRSFSEHSGNGPGLDLDAEFKLGYLEVIDDTAWQQYGSWESDGRPGEEGERDRAIEACRVTLPEKSSGTKPRPDGQAGAKSPGSA